MKRKFTDAVHTKDWAFGFAIAARGTIKVDGRMWQYLRAPHFVLASERLPMDFKGHAGPPFDPPPARAMTEAYIAATLTEKAMETSGEGFHGIVEMILRSFEGENGKMPVSFGESDVPFDGRLIAMMQPFVAKTDTVTVWRGGVEGKEWLRFETPRVRFVAMRLAGDPVLQVARTREEDGDVTIDADRLDEDRDYALAFVRRVVSTLDDASVDPSLIRIAPIAESLRHGAEMMGTDARDVSMILREAARACDRHGFSWAEIDAKRVMS